MKKELYFLQATTAPYRTELFDLMSEEAIKKDMNIKVLYYKKMMKGRNWKVETEKFKHNFKIYDCYEKFIKNYPFYFSYSLINDIRKNPNAEIVLGVSWNDFIVFTLILLKRLGIIKNKLHFWVEANYMAGGMKRKSKIKNSLKNFIFNTVDGKLIIPGKIAEKTILDYWHLKNDYIFLPNTVNINFSNLEKLNLTNKLNIFIVARLQENYKGILNFFKNIDKNDMLNCEFYIAGDGPDKEKYETYIKSNELINIQLLGNLDREIVLQYYKSCDIFILPSFSDQNPLSVIEALFASKPILISNQCGNYLETVQENVNGYIFDPYNQKDIKEKFSYLIKNRDRLTEMSEKSFKIANETFHPLKIVQSFLSKI